jgi:AcrR family transcriptional regulator
LSLRADPLVSRAARRKPAATPSVPPGLYEGSERRQEVLQHAATCFAAAGYRGTSMRAIAEASGMLAGSLYSHFDSKLQMLQELMARFFGVLLPRQRAAYEMEGTVAERLAAMVREVVEVCSMYREVVMVIEVDWHDIVGTPELDEVVAQGRENTLLFRRLLAEGVASGEVRDDIDLDCVVRLIHSAIYGLLDRRFRLTGLDGKRVNDFSAEQVSGTLNALFAGGLVASP